MSTNLIVMLAASGLLATNAPATTATRAAQALPTTRVAMAQTAPAKLPVGCFVPMTKGKLATLAELRKAKSNPACANPQATSSQGGFAGVGTGTFLAAAGGLALGGGIGYAIGDSNGGSGQPFVSQR